MAIKITYYGHACFKVVDGKESIVFDPYANNSVPGLKLPDNINANVVSCSHQHGDHNAKELINITNNHYSFKVEKLTVPHDDKNGELRGFSDITIITMDNKKIVHFGDLGRDLTEKEYQLLESADIIMIPCGGYYTIDAKQAKSIITKLKAKVNILMHYRQNDIGYDVLSDLDTIKKEFNILIEKQDSTYIYDPNSNGIIITLKPLQ